MTTEQAEARRAALAAAAQMYSNIDATENILRTADEFYKWLRKEHEK